MILHLKRPTLKTDSKHSCSNPAPITLETRFVDRGREGTPQDRLEDNRLSNGPGDVEYVFGGDHSEGKRDDPHPMLAAADQVAIAWGGP